MRRYVELKKAVRLAIAGCRHHVPAPSCLGYDDMFGDVAKTLRELNGQAKCREEILEKARKALREIQSVCQAIGTTAVKASRCDIDGKLGKKRWKIYDELNNQASELKQDIRDALRELE